MQLFHGTIYYVEMLAIKLMILAPALGDLNREDKATNEYQKGWAVTKKETLTSYTKKWVRKILFDRYLLVAVLYQLRGQSYKTFYTLGQIY